MKIPNANSIDALHYFLLDPIVCISQKTDPWPTLPVMSAPDPLTPLPDPLTPRPDPWPCDVSPTPPPPSPLDLPLPGSPQVGPSVGCWPVGPSLPPSTHWLPASGCSLPHPPQLPHSWQGDPSMYFIRTMKLLCTIYFYLNAIS